MTFSYASNRNLIIYTTLILILIATFTVPKDLLDATDVKDYSDTAKFFAGDYSANLRTSHSVLYGLLLSPYVKIVDSYFFLKFSSTFFLVLIILSLYYLSGKKKETLLLAITLPLIWYMSPWVSPLPLVALLFLWAYVFIKKFDEEGKIKNLLYSGLLIGLAGAFWDTAFYFSFIFLITFLYNKKFYYSLFFLTAVFVGMLPNFIVDYIIFEFPFYSKLKHISAVFAFAFYGGIYGQGFPTDLFSKILVLLFVPWYMLIFKDKKSFLREKKTLIFLILSFLFIWTNSQIRLLIVIAPIIVLLLGERLTKKQVKVQVIIFIILSLLVISPYIIQTKYQTNGRYFKAAVAEWDNLIFSDFEFEKIQSNLETIGMEFKGEKFVVLGKDDDYRELAHYYWGTDIEEFVSVQDYKLFLRGDDTIASKEIRSNAPSDFRRELFFDIGLRKNRNDDTDYASLKYGLSFSNSTDVSGFELRKGYGSLYLFEKI